MEGKGMSKRLPCGLLLRHLLRVLQEHKSFPRPWTLRGNSLEMLAPSPLRTKQGTQFGEDKAISLAGQFPLCHQEPLKLDNPQDSTGPTPPSLPRICFFGRIPIPLIRMIHPIQVTDLTVSTLLLIIPVGLISRLCLTSF